MSYLISLYDLPLVASLYVCLVLTTWMSDSQHIHVIILFLLVTGTKYSHTLLLNITFFDLFIILFNWDESNYKVSKLYRETSLLMLGNEISYHAVFGAPLYIKFLLTDTFSDEKETNVDVLGGVATL